MSDEKSQPSSEVDAVVVNFNAGDALVACVESLRRAGVVRIVVADNASSDGSLVSLRTTFPDVKVVDEEKNRGYGTAANDGARLGDGRYVLVSNPDVTVEKDAVERLVAVLEGAPDVAAVGPRVVDAKGETYPSARSFPGIATGAVHAFVGLFRPSNRWSKRYRREDAASGTGRDADWVSGAFVLVRRVAFDSIGGFDEGYFMYVEDLDLCWRLRRAGWRVRYEPTAVVAHDQGLSTRHHAYRMLAAHHLSSYRFARKSMAGWKGALVPLVGAGLVVRFWLAVAREWRARRRRGAPAGHG